MAVNINKVMLQGRLGADAEVRRMNNGNPVANLRVATSQYWRDKKSGERKEATEWHNVVIFNEHICSYVEKYGKKGREVFVEGQLQTRKWQDQNGNDRYTTEVVLQRYNGNVQFGPMPEGQKANDQDADGSYESEYDGDYERQALDDGEIPF